MTKLSVALTLVAVATGLFVSFNLGRAEKPAPAEPKKTIAVGDLNEMDVIGRLGKRLGTVVTVEGIIADGTYTNAKSDDGQTLLRILIVDGKKLASEQVFQLSTEDKPKVGSEFKYIGWEDGRFTGVPAEVFKYTPSYATTGYYFTTRFWVLRDENKKNSSR